MPDPVRIDLSQLAQHIDVQPGGEIVLRGSYTSTRDGSTIDAATTTWSKDAPGGESVDAGGLIDLEHAGFHVTSRDPASHEVHAVATGEAAAACDAAQVAAPCIALRVIPQARTRLMTVNEWTGSLKGAITVESTAPPVLAPVERAASAYAPALGALALVAAVAGALVFWSRRKKRFAASPAGRLVALTEAVKAKLARADAIVAAPLAPAIEHAMKAVRSRRVDPSSAEGKRVIEALKRVEVRLDASAEKQRAEREQEAADELVRDVEAALEAADEATLEPRRASERVS